MQNGGNNKRMYIYVLKSHRMWFQKIWVWLVPFLSRILLKIGITIRLFLLWKLLLYSSWSVLWNLISKNQFSPPLLNFPASRFGAVALFSDQFSFHVEFPFHPIQFCDCTFCIIILGERLGDLLPIRQMKTVLQNGKAIKIKTILISKIILIFLVPP